MLGSDTKQPYFFFCRFPNFFNDPRWTCEAYYKAYSCSTPRLDRFEFTIASHWCVPFLYTFLRCRYMSKVSASRALVKKVLWGLSTGTLQVFYILGKLLLMAYVKVTWYLNRSRALKLYDMLHDISGLNGTEPPCCVVPSINRVGQGGRGCVRYQVYARTSSLGYLPRLLGIKVATCPSLGPYEAVGALPPCFKGSKIVARSCHSDSPIPLRGKG